MKHHDVSIYDPSDRGPVRGNTRHFKSGGGSSGGTTTTALPSWMQPYQRNILNMGQDLANRPFVPYGGQRVAQFSPDEQAAFDAIRQRATQGDPAQKLASSSLADTLSGKYLNGNPYLDQMVNRAQSVTANNYATGTAAQTDANAAKAMGLGNTGYFGQVAQNQDALGRNLGDIATQMYGQNYANERSNMMDAARLAPSVAAAGYNDASMLGQIGSAQRARDQGLLDIGYQDFLDQQNWPVQNLGILSNALGAAAGGTGVSTSTMRGGGSTGGLQGALGGAASGAAIGSFFPGWGTAIGAGVGGLGGLLGVF
jgi:hypothetical protein